MALREQRVADLERENAELRRHLAEAVAQQTATAEVLQVINSSPGDLAPVFDAILGKAQSLCGDACYSLQLYDGGKFRSVAVHNVAGSFAELLREPIEPIPGSPPWRLLAGENSIQITDMAELANRNPDDPRAQAAAAHGLRTLLFVPLRKDAELLGYIAAFRNEARPFSDKQIALLQNFAAQAVIAMENARLITETRERTRDLQESLEYQTATSDVLKVISQSAFDLQPVLETLAETAARLCNSEIVTILSQKGDAYRVAAAQGWSPKYKAFLENHIFAADDRGTLTGRVALECRAIQVPDITADPEYRLSEAATLGKARTQLGVPLLREDHAIGVIIVSRQRVEPFTQKEVDLVTTFADQAVIAMENARLLTETREALEQQTATAEVLGVINSSPGDLGPVFDAILEKAHSLCGAEFGGLLTYDGEFVRLAAERNLPPAWADLVRAWQPRHDHPVSRIIRGERLFQVDDMAEIARTSDDPVVRAAVDLGGIRTLLLVPLRKDKAFLGYITAYRQEVRPFTDKQIALLQNFAEQAVIAMENARLITETREALEQQTATAEVLGVINSSPGDLAPVFEAILEKAHSLCGAAHGSLQLYDGESLSAVATHAVSDKFADILRQGYRAADSPASRALIEGKPFVHIDDSSEIDHPVFRSAAEFSDIGTVLFVPLRRDDAFLGLISAARQEVRPFSDKQIALLQNFAAQAVIAMENARLLGELRARTDEVAAWNRELEDRVAAQLGELERVGKLKRFLAPQLAEALVAGGDEGILETHRRDIVVVFCDLRGFTSFAETAEPEEVLDLLREYHAALGPIVSASEGTLDHFSGDGIMVFFNDPLPVPDAAERVVRMATAMRAAMGELTARWRRLGREIGFGAGIAQGYATLGQIGFAERIDYTAIGTVCNLAARLCGEAKDGQILVSRRVAAAVDGEFGLEELGELALKGLVHPVAVYNVPCG